MKFSIIVPAYNMEPYIAECLDHLVNQDYPKEDYEIIVIDDCSIDAQNTIIGRYMVDNQRHPGGGKITPSS